MHGSFRRQDGPIVNRCHVGVNHHGPGGERNATTTVAAIAWEIARGEHPGAAAAVLAALVLLGVGSVLSWNKRTLLEEARSSANHDGSAARP